MHNNKSPVMHNNKPPRQKSVRQGMITGRKGSTTKLKMRSTNAGEDVFFHEFMSLPNIQKVRLLLTLHLLLSSTQKENRGGRGQGRGRLFKPRGS